LAVDIDFHHEEGCSDAMELGETLNLEVFDGHAFLEPSRRRKGM